MTAPLTTEQVLDAISIRSARACHVGRLEDKLRDNWRAYRLYRTQARLALCTPMRESAYQGLAYIGLAQLRREEFYELNAERRQARQS